MDYKEYQIGHGVDSISGHPLWIGYRPFGPDWAPAESIAIQVGAGPCGESWVYPPKKMLGHRPYAYPVIDEKIVSNSLDLEPPGWFEQKCKEANCKWFVPLVERMAAGEKMPLEEIQATYVAHNGERMPCGKWSQLFQ